MEESRESLKPEWIERLNKLGPEVVKARLANTAPGTGAEFRELMDGDNRNPDRGFVEEWLAKYGRKQEKESKCRFFVIVSVGLLGIMATIIAAILT